MKTLALKSLLSLAVMTVSCAAWAQATAPKAVITELDARLAKLGAA